MLNVHNIRAAMSSKTVNIIGAVKKILQILQPCNAGTLASTRKATRRLLAMAVVVVGSLCSGINNQQSTATATASRQAIIHYITGTIFIRVS